MWLTTQQIADVLGDTTARNMMTTICNNKTFGGRFKVKLKMGYAKHRNHRSNEIIDIRTVLRHIDIVDAIEVYRDIMSQEKYKRFNVVHQRIIDKLEKVVKYYEAK